MELTRLKGKLVTARKGHKLLKDKRDELMRQFLEMVRENKALREKVELEIANANRNFALARSAMSDEAVRVAFMAPKQKVSLEVAYKNIMSVEVPSYTFRTRTSCRSRTRVRSVPSVPPSLKMRETLPGLKYAILFSE